MEGTGGVVAVVQGLPDAGLAVTLVSQRYRPSGRSMTGTGMTNPNEACQTVADSATETAAKSSPRDTIYKSSYQLAHCHPAEFSPVRLPKYSLQGFQQCRSSTSRSPDEEAFVGSLRKYPISPVRSRSADLIERMLSYTQSKNGARNSSARSAKSLPSKEASKYLHTDEIPTRDTGIATKDLRSNFGYKRDIELIPVPMKSRISRNDNQIGMYDYLKTNHKDKKLKGAEVRYLTNVKQCLRERLRQICDEEPATICPKIQNRYSQHRRQYHRAESSQKSPKVNYCKNLEKCTDLKDKMMQDSTQNEIQISPSTSRERKESQVERTLSSFKHNKACFCVRPDPCDCGTQPSRSILKHSIDKHKRCISICEYTCPEAEDVHTKQMKEIILKWSQELPVYAHFNANDAMKKQHIIDELIDNLGQLQRDNTYFDKVEGEIKKCIKVLPMWRPDDKVNQESFENQLALSLLQKIKSAISEKNDLRDEILKWIESIPFTRDSIDKGRIADDLINKLKPITLNRPFTDKDYKETLKSEIAGTLNDLPIEFCGSRSTVINNMADKLVEKVHLLPLNQPPHAPLEQSDIKNVILDWVKNVPQISDLHSDDNVLVNDLIMKLSNLQNKDTEYKQEQINDVVTNWLNSVEEKKKCRIDRSAKNMLTSQLVDKLVDLPQIYLPRENINYAVQKWYSDISDTIGLQFVDNQKDLEILVTKLQDLQSIENDENRQNSMRQEILKWLQNIQRKQGRFVDSGIQENYVNKLVSMIKGESHLQNIVPENGLITQNIWKWLKSQPEFQRDNAMQYKDMVIELSKKLQNIKDEKGELTEYDMKEEVMNWFEKLSQERGIQIDTNNRKQLQDQLFSFVSPGKRRKSWEKPNNIQELLSKDVSDILNQSAIRLEENDKKQLKDQIIKVISQDWNTINSSLHDEATSKIMKILRQTTNLPESQISGIAHTLIEKVKGTTLSNVKESIGEGPLILDNTAKDRLKSKVLHILKTLPLKDEEQVIDTITDTLIKNCEEIETNTAFEVIYETLKRANTNETVAREVTNKILEMSNEFKNEITDTTHQSPSYGSAESLWVHKQMFMQRLEREITDFMEKVLNESSSFNKDTTSGGAFHSEALEDSVNHYNKFKSSPLKTSTPTKSQNDQDMNIENQCKNQIKEMIRNWIISLKIDGIDETFKDNMAHDIATDIIDRHRYIQLSKTKRSSQDELEHLKYQIFKWTSKLPTQIDLTTKTAEIKTLLKSLDVSGITNLIREEQGIANKKVDTRSLTEYSSNIITQDTADFLEENIYGAIWNWLNEIPSIKPRNSQDRRIMDEIITELSNKLKHILCLNENTQISNIEDLCKDEIVNYLKKLNTYSETAEEQLEHRASDLLNELKTMEYFVSILERNQEICQDAANTSRKKDAIKKAIKAWCQKLPLKKGKTYDDMKDIVDNLAEAVSRYLLITDMENINIFMDDILSNLKQLPLQFDKEDSKLLPVFTEKLIETLKGVLNDSETYYTSVQEFSTVRKPAFKKAAQVMYDNIQNWCENLPLDLDIANDDIEKIDVIKQNLAGKLLKKVGELNLDPEIFHDDYLYEDLLQDEIEKILDDLPKSKQLEEVLPTLRKNLMKDLLEAKEGMKNEIAGFAYKQLLRDAISKTLSSIGLSISEETPLEVLKDNLADAFINLHYSADHEEVKRQFKEKIFNEVNKFCNEYLKRNPTAQLNVHDLNQELYKALKNVPVPKEESMRREVEQIRVKDVVTEWFQDLPLEETLSHNQGNKIITILAKRLHEIENEAEMNPDMDIDETMNNEISKWLKKFKLKSEHQSSIELVKKNLINKLKATKNSRKLNDTTTRKSINYTDLTSDLDNTPHYPPSNLSADDRAHLKRIKDRTSMERKILKPDDKKDASVSPGPVATGIQTEEKRLPDSYVFQKISQNASIQTLMRDTDPPTSITPQVIVKEYYWNTHGSPTTQGSGSILSCTQPPMTQLAENTTQKSNITSQYTPHVTTASQTKPLPVSKATITQEASIGQVIKTHPQNDSIGTSTQDPCLTTIATDKQLSNEINLECQTRYYNPDDYLQLNVKKRAEMKSCRPCRERAVLPGEFEGSPQAGTSQALQRMRLSEMGQTTNERTDLNKCRPEFWSAGHIDEDKNHLNDQNDLNQSCYRRLVCQTPTNDVECRHKRKKRSQQPCVCRSPLLTKCTIRPRSPCQHSHHSNKSCYVSEKHCPKCWDGFCPHPSYLYFKQD